MGPPCNSGTASRPSVLHQKQSLEAAHCIIARARADGEKMCSTAKPKNGAPSHGFLMVFSFWDLPCKSASSTSKFCLHQKPIFPAPHLANSIDSCKMNQLTAEGPKAPEGLYPICYALDVGRLNAQTSQPEVLIGSMAIPWFSNIRFKLPIFAKLQA